MALQIKSEADIINKLGQAIYIVGTQWGDEGKGKLVDILSGQYDITARCAGGANAGHTICLNENGETKKFSLHLLPSGILREDKMCIIGNGTVIHIPTLFEEIEMLKSHNVKTEGRILISDKAHLLMEYHKIIDGIQEDSKKDKKVGTTKRGIGPAYADKISRSGIMVADLFNFESFAKKLRENAERHMKNYHFDFDIEKEINYYRDIAELLPKYVVNTSHFIDEQHKSGKTLLIEGAQGSMLDIDHGTYPYVTSSNTTTGGACTGLGFAPNKIKSVVGIMKAYTTRVGEGPFPTELPAMEGDMLREQGGEYGTTTGRPRRCGWLDLNVARYAIQINGINSINLTKLDVLTGFKKIKIATHYLLNGEKINYFPTLKSDLESLEIEYLEMDGWEEDISKIKNFEKLPENARLYVKKIEELISVPVNFIGVGVHRDEMIFR